MTDGTRRRLRKLAIGLAFAVAVFATAATTAPSVSIPIPTVRGSFRLDPDHPGALTRITIRVNAEASAASFQNGAALSLTAVRVAGASAKPFGALDAAHFIVTTLAPGVAGAAPASTPPGGGPDAGEFQAELELARQVSLPMQCGLGPCERAFWLIGELNEPYDQPIEVDWEVRGALVYPSDTWPSGAAATVDADPPILLAAPLPQLVASTEDETITLGPERPVSARVVEVRIGAAAIPSDRSPVAALSVDVRSGGSYENRPAVAVYALGQRDGPGGAVDVPSGKAIPNGVDPFADCKPGAACTRRFLVTIAWTGSAGPVDINWQLTIRRVDLIRAWSTPAEVSARVTRQFNVAQGTKSKAIHLEGKVTPVAYDSPPQVHIRFSTVTTSTDPIAAFLPVPAVMTFNAQFAPGVPLPSGSGIPFLRILPPVHADQPGRNLSMPLREPVTIIANPVAGCDVAQACAEMTAGVTQQTAASTGLRIRWSMDVAVYSFMEIPVSLSVEGGS